MRMLVLFLDAQASLAPTPVLSNTCVTLSDFHSVSVSEVADMVSDMVVDMMADMVADIDINIEIQFGERVGQRVGYRLYSSIGGVAMLGNWSLPTR